MKHEKADRCHFSRSGDLGLRSALYSRCRIVCVRVFVCAIFPPPIHCSFPSALINTPIEIHFQSRSTSNRINHSIESRLSIRSNLFVLVLDL